jgi:hypothetical protein
MVFEDVSHMYCYETSAIAVGLTHNSNVLTQHKKSLER